VILNLKTTNLLTLLFFYVVLCFGVCMSKELDKGVLIGSGSIDSKIWVLRKAYGEKAAVFAYLAEVSNAAELELCASIAKILSKSLDSCLEQPQIAVSIIKSITESSKALGIPVSLKELMAGVGGGGGGEEEEQEQR